MIALGPAASGPGRGAAERLIELAVYAPVGLLARARDELPTLIAEGRARTEARLEAARLIGRLAVDQGRRTVRERLDAAVRSRSTDASHEPSAATPADVAGAATSSQPGRFDADAPGVDDLAVEHYDSLAAAQVVDLLPSLSIDELADIERYELAHRNRRTIIGKIAQLRV